jgi:membrane associated rhomboid family serine protease
MGFLRGVASSPAVLAIIAVLFVVFIAQTVNPSVAAQLSLPGDAAELGERPWALLTVMFLHENVVHYVLMVFTLAAFGALLEHVASPWDVVAVYLLSGLAGSLAITALAAASPADEAVVGASAAVFGVAAAVLIMDPSARIFGGTAKQWLAMLVGINIVFLLTLPLGSVGHLAGLAVGAAYGWRLRRVRTGAPPRSGARTCA